MFATGQRLISLSELRQAKLLQIPIIVKQYDEIEGAEKVMDYGGPIQAIVDDRAVKINGFIFPRSINHFYVR